MPPEPSSASVKVFYPHREALIERLRAIAQRIQAQHPEVRSIALFGSLARSDYTALSDADVLILLDRSTEDDLHRRILRFLPYFDLDCGVDLLVYTEEEIERRLRQGDPFIQRIRQESIELL